MRANVTHNSRRRIRLRIPGAKRDNELLKRIATRTREVGGVDSTEFNPSTGSILIRYAEAAVSDLEAIRAALSGSELALELIEPWVEEEAEQWLEEKSETAERLESLLREADAAVKWATANKVDLRLLLPLAALALGVANFSRKNAPTPLWITLMIFAFTSFAVLDQKANRMTDPRPQERASQSYLH
jgi:hypothetical protein